MDSKRLITNLQFNQQLLMVSQMGERRSPSLRDEQNSGLLQLLQSIFSLPIHYYFILFYFNRWRKCLWLFLSSKGIWLRVVGKKTYQETSGNSFILIFYPPGQSVFPPGSAMSQDLLSCFPLLISMHNKHICCSLQLPMQFLSLTVAPYMPAWLSKSLVWVVH